MVPVSSRPSARILVAAVFMIMPLAVRAQTPPAPAPPPADMPLDPSTGLEPLPDLGVDWPDPAAIDAANPSSTPAEEVKAVPTDRQQHYRVVLEGAEPLGEMFHTRFNELSALVANEGKAANTAQLDRRALDDEELVRQLLRAAGRYDGNVSSAVVNEPGETATIVRLTIDPGEPYLFSDVVLPGLETVGPASAGLRTQFAIKANDPVDADAVTAAVTAFRAALGREGYPFAKVGDPQVTVDHETHRAKLALDVTPGARARFGRIVPTGPRQIFSAEHLSEIARFHPGDSFDTSRLDDFRRALIATGLVSAATVTAVATADPGVVDVAVRIDRAPPRTIAGELGYGTGEGARAEISWQHRNLIKPEGAVTFRAVAGTSEQSLGATLRQSNFHARDRILTAQIVASHTNFNAYDARTFTVGGSIERQTNIIWQKTWSWSLGTEFIASDERDTIQATGQPRRRTFLVAATPASLSYDGSDDLLNPTRGYRIAGRVSPEVSLQSGADVYVKLQFDASAYQPISKSITLAGRVRFGSIQGADRDNIAPSRRFYAGGGGSVRGFSYQKIGPVDVNGDPIGGRALTELSAEARIRFGVFGVVPFLDAGNLYSSTIPRFSGLRFGTGLGVRYYSSFGPIRVDVGTPVNRRPGESRVAVYVSLGQAF